MHLKSTASFSTKILNYSLKNPQKPTHKFTPKQIKEIQIKQFEKPLEMPNFPSVSKILRETMPEENRMKLQKWEEEMIKKLGQEDFDALMQETKDTGTSMHTSLTNYYLTNRLNCEILGKGNKETVKTLVKSVEHCLKDFQPLHLESHVVHSELGYHGYMDAVMYSKQRKQLIVLDWKTSKRPKTTLHATFDNPLQLAAYVGALNYDERYPYQVEGACLVIAYNFYAKANVLHVGKAYLKKYWDLWLQRLELYNKKKLDT